MKKGLCFVYAMVIGFCVFAQKPAKPIELKPQVKFESDTFDYGSLKESEPAVHFFAFKNTGNAPLIIVKVDKSCGCTTPQWPTEPIKPGATGKIRVEYDTKGRIGDFTKAVFVYTNVPGPPIILIIKGTVEMPPQPEQKMEIPQH